MTHSIPEVDRWIHGEFQRLAEIIQDYEPTLELRWIPPERRIDPEDSKNAFCIWDTRTNSVVMFASEWDNPHDILAKLVTIDNEKTDVLAEMQAKNLAKQIFDEKERQDAKAEAKDFAAFAIGNTKSRWKHNGIWYDDEMRRL